MSAHDTNKMEQLTAEINKVSTKIDAIEVLLKKHFQNWTEDEKEELAGKNECKRKRRKEAAQRRKEGAQNGEGRKFYCRYYCRERKMLLLYKALL